MANLEGENILTLRKELVMQAIENYLNDEILQEPIRVIELEYDENDANYFNITTDAEEKEKEK